MNEQTFLALPDAEWERMTFLHGVYERALQRACSIQGVPDDELVAIHVGKATVELATERPEAYRRAFGDDLSLLDELEGLRDRLGAWVLAGEGEKIPTMESLLNELCRIIGEYRARPGLSL